MNSKIILFNPSIATMNEGDHIIYSCITREITEMFPNSKYYELPTQMPVSKRVLKWFSDIDIRFLCGTNIIQRGMVYDLGRHFPHFIGIRQWDLDILNLDMYKPIILFGCGWRMYQRINDSLSAKVWKKLLNPEYMHSVRDEYTKLQLEKMGITNVINTGCPTVWSLTKEFCDNIPRHKAENVVTTITDYGTNIGHDQKMLDTLADNYHCVYLWVQGYNDDKYMQQLELRKNIVLISGGLKQYDDLLNSDIDIEYVGTRLHGGVRALQHGRRTTFIAIDNRTIEMGKNLNFNMLHRDDINSLAEYLKADRESNIHIPEDRIRKFNMQFTNS
jgi:polysaccharide pyruvyl transferase WcaK-like protein